MALSRSRKRFLTHALKSRHQLIS